MFAGKKSAQIREILISESAWEEMTCLFAPSLAYLALKGKEAEEAAKKLGFDTRIPPQKAPFNSHGQPVYSDGKKYITPDIDSHNVTNGWKMFDRKGNRIGTYDSNLNRIKD